MKAATVTALPGAGLQLGERASPCYHGSRVFGLLVLAPGEPLGLAGQRAGASLRDCAGAGGERNSP